MRKSILLTSRSLLGKRLHEIKDHPYPLMNNFPAEKVVQPRRDKAAGDKDRDVSGKNRGASGRKQDVSGKNRDASGRNRDASDRKKEVQAPKNNE